MIIPVDNNDEKVNNNVDRTSCSLSTNEGDCMDVQKEGVTSSCPFIPSWIDQSQSRHKIPSKEKCCNLEKQIMKLLFCLSLYQHYSKDALVLDANKHGNTQNSENGNSLSYVNTTFLSSLSSIFNTFCKYYSYFASSENGDCLINNCYCYSSDEFSSSFNSPFSLNDDSYQDDPISLISSSSLHQCISSSPTIRIINQQLETSFLLPPQSSSNQGKKTLVLDLDETLVHASLSSQDPYDFSWCSDSGSGSVNGNDNHLYIKVRPGVSHFLQSMSKVYELVIFTASTENYANYVISKIDPFGLISHCLFRNHCSFYYNYYVKDLSRLGRSLDSVVIIDNSRFSFQLQVRNGIECKAFINDLNDSELTELEPFLLYLSSKSDVRKYTSLWESTRD